MSYSQLAHGKSENRVYETLKCTLRAPGPKISPVKI